GHPARQRPARRHGDLRVCSGSTSHYLTCDFGPSRVSLPPAPPHFFCPKCRPGTMYRVSPPRRPTSIAHAAFFWTPVPRRWYGARCRARLTSRRPVMSEPTEFRTLLRRLREGDGDAVVEFIERYGRAVRTFAHIQRVRLHVSPADMDSEDVQQAVLASFC